MEALLSQCPLQTPAAAVADASGVYGAGDSGRFLIFSLSKTFTALAVLQVATRLGHSLDRPFWDWLMLPNGSKVTLRQILNHTSGLPNYGRDPEYHAEVKRTPESPWSF